MINVTLPSKRLTTYAKLGNKKLVVDIDDYAKRLRPKQIVEINSTSEGGGVAEMLKSYIPLMNDLGLKVAWRVLMPDPQFFRITKTIHNCLQGICPLPPAEELKYYNEYLARQSRYLPPADLYVLHDPQTLGLIDHLPPEANVIWRCHIDLTSSDHSTLEWVRGYYDRCAQVIFSLDNYALGIDKDKITIIRPAIDPLSDKNRPLSAAEIKTALSEFNVEPERPFITQISRYDKFKNPIGVLDIFAGLKQKMPDLGCVLMGNYATDDPEGYPYFQELRRKVTDLKLPNIRLITKDDDTLVNALQRSARAVLQNSSREGFGLTVTEAQYKGNLVFARPVGGIALQVIEGKTGFYLFDDAQQNIDRIHRVLANRDEFAGIQKAAVRHVRDHFLITRMLRDHLELYCKVLKLG